MSEEFNCCSLELVFIDLGYNLSIEHIEAISLLESDSYKQIMLRFKSEEDLYDYIEKHGMRPYMNARHYEHIRNTENTLVEWTSPIPIGCPFLLRYVIHPNGSGWCF